MAHAKRLGLSPLVVGSLDEEMHEKCLAEAVPSIYLNGSSILQTGPVKYFSTGTQRASPSPAATYERACPEFRSHPDERVLLSDLPSPTAPRRLRQPGVQAHGRHQNALRVGAPEPRPAADPHGRRRSLARGAPSRSQPASARGLTPLRPAPRPRRLRDPREYFQRGSLALADVLVSSDCIEVPNDEQWRAFHPLGPVPIAAAHELVPAAPSHLPRRLRREGGGECDTTVNFNTGTLFLRNTAAALEFAGRWHGKVLQSEERWMRDQPAFNLLARGADGLQMRARPPAPTPHVWCLFACARPR